MPEDLLSQPRVGNHDPQVLLPEVVITTDELTSFRTVSCSIDFVDDFPIAAQPADDARMVIAACCNLLHQRLPFGLSRVPVRSPAAVAARFGLFQDFRSVINAILAILGTRLVKNSCLVHVTAPIGACRK